jgi:hypothetical protein
LEDRELIQLLSDIRERLDRNYNAFHEHDEWEKSVTYNIKESVDRLANSADRLVDASLNGNGKSKLVPVLVDLLKWSVLVAIGVAAGGGVIKFLFEHGMLR